MARNLLVTSCCRLYQLRTLSSFVSRYYGSGDRIKEIIKRTVKPKYVPQFSVRQDKPRRDNMALVVSNDNGTTENDFLRSLVKIEPLPSPAIDTCRPVLQRLSKSADYSVSKQDWNQLLSELRQFNESDLFALLSTVSRIKNDRYLFGFLKVPLDNVLTNWLSSVDLDIVSNVSKAFQIVDAVNTNKLNVRGKFAVSLRNNLLNRIDSLNHEQFKCLLFIINLSRTPLTASEQLVLENKVSKVIQDITFEELSLVTTSFFKTQTKILNQGIIIEIVNKLEENLLSNQNSHSVIYASVFKFLRHSFLESSASEIRKLIKSLDSNNVSRLNLMSMVHLNNLASQYLQPNQDISAALLRLCTMDQNARLKDITHALRIAYDFHVQIPDSTFDTLIRRIEAMSAIYRQPRHLYHFLGFLNLIGAFGKFPTGLIRAAIELKKDEKHWNKWDQEFNEKMDMSHQWLQFHTLIQLYRPELGPILTEVEMYQISQEIGYSDPSEFNANRMSSFEYSFNRLYQGVGYIFGSQNVTALRVLPESFFPEIVVTINDASRQKVLKAVDNFCLQADTFKDTLLINLKHRQHFSDSNDTLIRGYYQTRMKLFQRMGFNVLDIHWMNVAAEGKMMIGKLVQKKLREKIDTGLIDQKFSVLLTVNEIYN